MNWKKGGSRSWRRRRKETSWAGNNPPPIWKAFFKKFRWTFMVCCNKDYKQLIVSLLTFYRGSTFCIIIWKTKGTSSVKCISQRQGNIGLYNMRLQCEATTKKGILKKQIHLLVYRDPFKPLAAKTSKILSTPPPHTHPLKNGLATAHLDWPDNSSIKRLLRFNIIQLATVWLWFYMQIP